MRYGYFVTCRGWVAKKPHQGGLEYDDYDPYVTHLSVWDGSEPLAYLRVLPQREDVGFMLDREFSALLSEDVKASLLRENAVELSRLVCAPLAGNGRAQPHPVELLLRELYRLSLERGIERYYAVVEESWLRPFERRFGLPLRPLGEPYTFPDGTRTVAVAATLQELEAAVRSRDLAKYQWYRGLKVDE